MAQANPENSKRKWIYQPDIDQQMAPFYDWPPKVGASIKYILQSWSPFSIRIYVVALAVITWIYFSPDLERAREFSFDWIAQIWIRNLIIMLAVAGGLHLYLYYFRKQGDTSKYDPRDLNRNSKLFHFGNQVWDNMFWVLVSAVSCWTAYEVLMMWAYANGIAPYIEFFDNPAWFLLLIFLTPWWAGLHFYCQHRLLHTPWLYRVVHSWHHKNSNTGPWSGAAMHPIEHLVWISDVFIFLLLASHPIHAIFILQFHAITATTSHCGFEDLLLSKRIKIRLGDFFHQQHHRYCDCNYGTFETPWDRWFDTYHDGTDKGDAWMKQRRRDLTQQKTVLDQ